MQQNDEIKKFTLEILPNNISNLAAGSTVQYIEVVLSPEI